MIHIDKINEVLNRDYFEGPQMHRGYIPCNIAGGGTSNYKGGARPERYIPMGASGVTVATGVDLGQTSAAELESMGVPREIIAKLRPYIGLQKTKAVMALYNRPFVLTKAEADVLDAKMHGHHVEMIARRYDKDAGEGAFETLPWQAQAVIFSLLYQCGCTGGPKKDPATWRALCQKNWLTASKRLMTREYWSGYSNRRRAEGQILAELL